MPDVVKHAWTHRPKAEGGTDPVPFPEPTWANATRFVTGVAKTGSVYRPRFGRLGTNDPDNFTLGGGSAPGADYLYISKAGYYVARFGVVTESGSTHTWGANYTILQPIYGLTGSGDNEINTGVNGESDWTASDYARNHEQYAAEYSSVSGQTGHRGLWTEYVFHYDPSNPQADFEFENPLGIAVQVQSAKTGTVNLFAQVHVIRLCAPGFTVQSI